MKSCPQCAEQVQDAAQVCRHCGHKFSAFARADQGLRNIGCLGAFLIFVIIAFVAGIFSPQTNPVGNAAAPTMARAAAQVGPAPYGDAEAVARYVLHKRELVCGGGVYVAVRDTSDSSITAICNDGRKYRVFSVNGEPEALDCAAASQSGIEGAC